MIEKIKQLNNEEAKALLIDFMDVYFKKGFGIMNKTEIETLIYDVLKKHKLLSGKCFDDSVILQISEAKARKLIYESQIKYAGWNKEDLDRYLRSAVGDLLTHANFTKSGNEIWFSIEDKYLRVALNAKLRSNYYFANTSFNRDIVTLDEKSFSKMVSLLVPNFQKEKVLERITAIKVDDAIEDKDALGFMDDIIKQIVASGSLEGLKQLGQFLMNVP